MQQQLLDRLALRADPAAQREAARQLLWSLEEESAGENASKPIGGEILGALVGLASSRDEPASLVAATALRDLVSKRGQALAAVSPAVLGQALQAAVLHGPDCCCTSHLLCFLEAAVCHQSGPPLEALEALAPLTAPLASLACELARQPPGPLRDQDYSAAAALLLRLLDSDPGLSQLLTYPEVAAAVLFTAWRPPQSQAGVARRLLDELMKGTGVDGASVLEDLLSEPGSPLVHLAAPLAPDMARAVASEGRIDDAALMVLTGLLRASDEARVFVGERCLPAGQPAFPRCPCPWGLAGRGGGVDQFRGGWRLSRAALPRPAACRLAGDGCPPAGPARGEPQGGPRAAAGRRVG